MALKMPVYVTINVENRDQAAKLLEQLSQQVDPAREPTWAGSASRPTPIACPTTRAIRSTSSASSCMRSSSACTSPWWAIRSSWPPSRNCSARSSTPARPRKANRRAPAHLLVRLNRRGLNRAYDDVQLYWEEKARTACNRNISSISNLVKLYGVKIDDVPRLSEAKYGVRYFCPDDGDYRFDAERNQVVCSVHGNREQSRQNPHARSQGLVCPLHREHRRSDGFAAVPGRRAA